MLKIIYYNWKQLKADRNKLLKDKKYFDKIKHSIESFASNPQLSILSIKKINPKDKNLFRIKVWNYRIIFSIDYWNNIMIVYRIAPRKDIYKKL